MTRGLDAHNEILASAYDSLMTGNIHEAARILLGNSDAVTAWGFSYPNIIEDRVFDLLYRNNNILALRTFLKQCTRPAEYLNKPKGSINGNRIAHIMEVDQKTSIQLFSAKTEKRVIDDRISVTIDLDESVFIGRYTGPLLTGNETLLPPGSTVVWRLM